MPDTNQHTSTISTKLSGPVAWRKEFLFIDSLIRLTFDMQQGQSLQRAGAESLLWAASASAAIRERRGLFAPSVWPAASHPPCLDFNRQVARRHPLLRIRRHAIR